MARAHTRISAHDRRQQIIQIAMRLFARQGFQGTTTREIADQAGVNEAIIFRHFPRKEALYWAVLDGKCHSAGGHGQLEAALRTPPDREKSASPELRDKEVFANIAEGILRRNREDSTLGRLLLFSALENHRLSHRYFRTHVASYYEALADYIRRRIRAGTFRDVDPLLAARGFLGMVVYHFLIQDLFGGRRYQRFETQHVSRTLAGIWLEGMRPTHDAQEASGRRRNARPPAAVYAETAARSASGVAGGKARAPRRGHRIRRVTAKGKGDGR